LRHPTTYCPRVSRMEAQQVSQSDEMKEWTESRVVRGADVAAATLRVGSEVQRDEVRTHAGLRREPIPAEQWH
jgi:hypothetical protein